MKKQGSFYTSCKENQVSEDIYNVSERVTNSNIVMEKSNITHEGKEAALESLQKMNQLLLKNNNHYR